MAERSWMTLALDCEEKLYSKAFQIEAAVVWELTCSKTSRESDEIKNVRICWSWVTHIA